MVIFAADAKSMAGFKPGLDKFASELCAAECRNMADQNVDLSDDYGEAACDINNKIGKLVRIVLMLS